jgi:hypothetical protein
MTDEYRMGKYMEEIQDVSAIFDRPQTFSANVVQKYGAIHRRQIRC